MLKIATWNVNSIKVRKDRLLAVLHVLATAPLAAACRDARIDREERKGKLPSDHAPVIATFEPSDSPQTVVGSSTTL